MGVALHLRLHLWCIWQLQIICNILYSNFVFKTWNAIKICSVVEQTKKYMISKKRSNSHKTKLFTLVLETQNYIKLIWYFFLQSRVKSLDGGWIAWLWLSSRDLTLELYIWWYIYIHTKTNLLKPISEWFTQMPHL